MTKRIVVVVVLFAMAMVFASQAGQGRSGLTCDAVALDPLDARSLQHALPGGPSPIYDTEPPTSGPHQAGRVDGGVLTERLSGPVQVGALEAGQVLLQHRDLDPAEQAGLEALAGPLVIVAPNPALRSRVVASAWRTRLACRSVDATLLREFIGDHAGRVP